MSLGGEGARQLEREGDQPLQYGRLLPILLVIFTNILGAGVIIPILPLYAEGEFNGTIMQITLLSSAFFGAQFLAAPRLGRLSDRYGRRPVLIISQAGTVLAFLLFIFAVEIGRWIDGFGLPLAMTGGMAVLYIARILDGITGGNITTAQAYVSDITTEKQRAQGLGLLQAAFGVGFIFGPAFGGLLSSFGPRVPFIGAAIITTGTLLLTTFTLKESLPEDKRAGKSEKGVVGAPLRVLLTNQAFSMVLTIGFVGSLSFSALPSVFALYANHVLFDTAANQSRVQLYVGLMLTFMGLMQVVTQLTLLKPLVTRLGERRLLVVGEISLFIAALGVAATGSPIMVTLFLAPYAFGQGVSEPSLQSLVTRFGDSRTRGRLLGYYQSSRSLALIIGPFWAGYAYSNFRPQAVFIVAAGLSLLALLFAIQLLRQRIQTFEVAGTAQT